MFYNMKSNRIIAATLSVLLLWAGVSSAASAALIGTREALAMEQRDTLLASVQARLAREDVQQAMVQLGVDPVEASLRVAALDQQELLQLQGQLEQLPAGEPAGADRRRVRGAADTRSHRGDQYFQQSLSPRAPVVLRCGAISASVRSLEAAASR